MCSQKNVSFQYLILLQNQSFHIDTFCLWKCMQNQFRRNFKVEKRSTLVEKQEIFVRFYKLPNTFWMILDDSY